VGQVEGTQASTRSVRLQQAIRYPSFARRLRASVDGAIDLVRLKLDAMPDGIYQPVPGLPVRRAKRAIGTQSRWEAMDPVIERLGVRSAMDVGANAGYFPVKLALRGIPVVAIDSNQRSVRTTGTAVRRNHLDNVAVMDLELRPDTVALLPATDCTLVLSLWHHLVREHGLGVATQLLEQLWTRTAKVMFFDSGEEEMPAWFGLPRMVPTPQAWLTDYLRETCTGGGVEYLGRHRAFDAAGRPTDRGLFAVIREEPSHGVRK
jgi:hypothetical protein